MRKHVLTGGPSVGKTTLLRELKKQRFSTLEETARDLILQEKQKQEFNPSYEPKLPTTHPYEFEVALYDCQKHQELHLPNKDIILDRSLVDIIAYSDYLGIVLPRDLKNDVRNANYSTIFLLDQLDLFEKDNVRFENASEAKVLHGLIENTYNKFGFDVVNVPNIGVQPRAEFVANYINKYALQRVV